MVISLFFPSSYSHSNVASDRSHVSDPTFNLRRRSAALRDFSLCRVSKLHFSSYNYHVSELIDI